MITHDYDLSQQKPSLLATGALYVSLKLGEKLKAKQRGYRSGFSLSPEFMSNLVRVSGYSEDEIIKIAKKVLVLSQTFEKRFAGLQNLKKTHFSKISKLLDLPR